MVLVVKNLAANAGDVRDVGSIPGWGRSPGEGNAPASLTWENMKQNALGFLTVPCNNISFR